MLLYLFLTFLSVCLFYLKYLYTYWERKGFPYIKPSIPFGNLTPVARRKVCLGVNILDLYRSIAAPFIGIYLLFRPAVLIRDAELARHIFTNSFNYFHDRGVYCSSKNDPLSETVFAMTGQQWRMVRAKLAPAFSSGKIKKMIPAITRQADLMCNHLETLIDQNDIIHFKDIAIRYGLNVISEVVFGIEVNTFDKPDHRIRAVEKELYNESYLKAIRDVALFLCPRLLELLHISVNSKSMQKLLLEIVKNTMEHRENNNIVRNDLMDYIVQLAKPNKSSMADINNDNDFKPLTIEQCAAQVFVFYVAGLDTVAATFAYTIFEFSKYPKVLQKARNELIAVFKNHNYEITNESLQDMTYLDLCIREVLRKYPALPVLNRECTENYNIPDTDLTIEKGTAVIISLLGISRDPRYFWEPEKFIPERFIDENFNPIADIPFGDGPRHCIAVRLGRAIVKIALATILLKLDFHQLNDREVEFDARSGVLVPKCGIKIRLSKRIN